MARSGEVTLAFGGEDRTFGLRIGQMRAIEEKTGASIPEILTAMHPLVQSIRSKLSFGQILSNGLMGAWRVDYYREVILQGLIGGGESPTVATALVTNYVDPYSPLESIPTAYEVLLAWVAGLNEEPLPVGEPKPAKRKRSRAAPSSPESTPAAA